MEQNQGMGSDPFSKMAHSGMGGRLWADGHARVRSRQPVAQVPCGLVWRRSIKRHQRRWNSRDADDVGPPALGVDGHHLDLVRATTDGLFKAMNSRMHSVMDRRRLSAGNGVNCHAAVTANQAKRRTKRASTNPRCLERASKGTQIFFHPRWFHRNCTVRQQFFHSLTLKVAHRTLKHT